jgi:hypothetical protein
MHLADSKLNFAVRPLRNRQAAFGDRKGIAPAGNSSWFVGNYPIKNKEN